MNIALDARGINLYSGTGIGTYTNYLYKNILNLNSENVYTLFWYGEGYKKYSSINSHIIYASSKHHSFFEDYYFPMILNDRDIDIYHIPQNGIGLNNYTNCKCIVTIHDLIPYIMPETVGKGYLLKFLNDMPYIIENSSAIITVSEWSKKDIIKFFPSAKDKVYVTPLAAESNFRPLDKMKCRQFIKNKYHIDKPFLLYIGGFSQRKNVMGLLEAYEMLPEKLKENYIIVLVGEEKDAAVSLRSAADRLKINNRIFFTGRLPSCELPVFYNACEIFVYPSIYEGFGLPPLEAMSCKVPVITSNITSIPEVTGDSAYLINPYDSSNLTDAIKSVLENEELKTSLSVNGFKRSKEFSWKKTAKNTLSVYEAAYNMVSAL